MLTYQDCLDWSALDQGEVDAISEHQQMGQILALAYGARLTQQQNGPRIIRKIIIDDIRNAQRHNNTFHAAELKRVLLQYIKSYPL